MAQKASQKRRQILRKRKEHKVGSNSYKAYTKQLGKHDRGVLATRHKKQAAHKAKVPTYRAPKDMTDAEKAAIYKDIQDINAPVRAQEKKGFDLGKQYRGENLESAMDRLRSTWADQGKADFRRSQAAGSAFGGGVAVDAADRARREGVEGGDIQRGYRQDSQWAQNAYDEALMALTQQEKGEYGQALRQEDKDRLEESRWGFGADMQRYGAGRDEFWKGQNFGEGQRQFNENLDFQKKEGYLNRMASRYSSGGGSGGYGGGGGSSGGMDIHEKNAYDKAAYNATRDAATKEMDRLVGSYKGVSLKGVRNTFRQNPLYKAIPATQRSGYIRELTASLNRKKFP